MAYHHTSPSQDGNGFGFAVLIILLVIAAGGFLATMMDDGQAQARVYLAEDISQTAPQR